MNMARVVQLPEMGQATVTAVELLRVS